MLSSARNIVRLLGTPYLTADASRRSQRRLAAVVSRPAPGFGVAREAPVEGFDDPISAVQTTLPASDILQLPRFVLLPLGTDCIPASKWVGGIRSRSHPTLETYRYMLYYFLGNKCVKYGFSRM